MTTQAIFINVTPREVRVAVLENRLLQDIYLERTSQQSLIGNIYRGRVKRILPGIQAAFIDIGFDRPGFLHESDSTGLLQPGQEIWVQVLKDRLGSKGVRLTMRLCISSRSLVLTPYVLQIAVSQKIQDPVECERLQAMLQPTDQGGFIFRTQAQGASQAAIAEEAVWLVEQWGSLKLKMANAAIGYCLYQEPPLWMRIARDWLNVTIEKIVVDDAVIAANMQACAALAVPTLASRIVHYAGLAPLFDVEGIETLLQQALETRVNLPSGGYLVFDRTEAMTTIDVNSGNYVGKTPAKKMVIQTNIEAANKIAQQLRLRNIGGIIVIDFIDMQEAADKAALLAVLKEAVAKDSVRVEVSDISSIGLVQMTRRRSRESLLHILCEYCPTCSGRGSLLSVVSVAENLFREIQRTAAFFPCEALQGVAAAEVVDYLMREERTRIAELEATLQKKIKIRADTSYKRETFSVLPA